MTAKVLGGGSILSELQRLLPGDVLRTVRFVSPDDPLHQWMADHIPIVEVNEGNSLHTGNHSSRFNQTRHFPDRQIDLGHVTRNNSFAVITDTCEEHLHLLGCSV